MSQSSLWRKTPLVNCVKWRFFEKAVFGTGSIYDILGRKLRCLVYRRMTPGNYTVMWNGKSENGRIVASGKYYCVLKADELKQIRNLTLIK